MKIFRVTKFIPKDDKEIRLEEFYAASHISTVIDDLALDLKDEAISIEAITEVAPSIKILK